MTEGTRSGLTSKCTWALLVGAAASASAVPFRVEWQEGPPFPERVKGGAVGVVDGLIVAAGGMNYPWRESAATYGFDPATGRWEALPDLPEGRAYTAGVSPPPSPQSLS